MTLLRDYLEETREKVQLNERLAKIDAGNKEARRLTDEKLDINVVKRAMEHLSTWRSGELSE